MLNSVWQRIITILVLLPIFIYFLLFASTLLFSLLMVVMMGLSLWEWSKMLGFSQATSVALSLILAAAVLPLWVLVDPNLLVSSGALLAVMLLLVFGFLPAPARHSYHGFWAQIVIWAVGAGVMLAFTIAMLTLHALSAPLLFTFLILIWALDIGAYVCGRLWGKHLLMPTVSPKKTWEGLIGGLLLVVSLLVLMPDWMHPHLQGDLLWLRAFPCIVVGAVLGDLWESWMKRCHQVKDSGAILPGHGGVLDRVDSWLLTMPLLAWVMLNLAG